MDESSSNPCLVSVTFSPNFSASSRQTNSKKFYETQTRKKTAPSKQAESSASLFHSGRSPPGHVSVRILSSRSRKSLAVGIEPRYRLVKSDELCVVAHQQQSGIRRSWQLDRFRSPWSVKAD